MYLQSSLKSVIQNLGQCKKELGELQSWVGEDLSGTDPKYLSGWKCCSLRMSTFFLIFYFFQVSAGITCYLQRPTYCHGFAVICVIPARFVQALGAGTKKTQKWFRGVGGGRFEEMSCPTLWLQWRKTSKNISAPLKILKLKGNNRTETHFKTRWFRVIPNFKMCCEGLHSVEILCSWMAHTSQHPGDYFSIAGEGAPQCNL